MATPVRFRAICVIQTPEEDAVREHAPQGRWRELASTLMRIGSRHKRAVQIYRLNSCKRAQPPGAISYDQKLQPLQLRPTTACAAADGDLYRSPS